MSPVLSPEQDEFHRTLRTFFAEKIPSEKLRARIDRPQVSDPKLWKQLMELGLSASFGRSVDGGYDLGFREISILAYESGFALLPEPVLPHSLAVYILSTLVSLEGKGKLKKRFGASFLPGIVAGRNRVSVIPLNEKNAQVTLVGNIVTGEVRFTPGVEGASHMILEASVEKKRQVVLAAVGAECEFTQVSSVDPTMLRFDAALHDAPCEVISIDPAQLRAMEYVLVACEIAGICGRVIETTVAFVKTRRQFDVPVGGFQAVQHRIADMYLVSEAMRALATFAAWTVEGSPEQLPLASRSALLFALEKGSEVVEGAIQMHGGIGFTWEYDLHLYLRRAKLLEAIYRSKRHQEEILALAV